MVTMGRIVQVLSIWQNLEYLVFFCCFRYTLDTCKTYDKKDTYEGCF